MIMFAAVVILSVLTIECVYHYMYLLAALFVKPGISCNVSNKLHSFALIIPAYNEACVIGCLVDSVNSSVYQQDMLHIIVVADNCTDDTAEIARNHGAIVWERSDSENRGKQHAIRWTLNKLDRTELNYDAVLIIDADNVVSKDYFLRINERLKLGATAFQTSVECKNTDDSWPAIMNYIQFCANNRIQQEGHYRLGLGASLCGSGMGFTKQLLDDVGWDMTTLKEDKELMYKLIVNDIDITWIGDAKLFAELPVKYDQNMTQLSRWVAGDVMVFKKYFPLLVLSLFKNATWRKLDALYFLLQPFMISKNTTALLLLLFAGNQMLWLWWGFIFVAMNLYFAAGLYLNKSPAKFYWYLITTHIYKLLALKGILAGFLARNNMAWNRTPHTKPIGVESLKDG